MISVVVLTHGAGALLAESLESLAGQTYRDLEILVVDDATGTSVKLPDGRFRLVKGGALSRGAARNLGVAQAEGEFLFFVEDGDRVPARALAQLHAAITASGSDLAAGNVATITESGGIWRSWIHREAFATSVSGTHIRKNRHLFHDRFVANKLFRRSFWDASGLSFPDGSRFEELAVAIPAHFLAKSVDLISEFVVYRRNDTTQPPASTQAQDVADGFEAIAFALDAMEGRWRPVDRRRFELTVLDREARSYLDALPDAEPDERIQIVEQAASYFDKTDQKIFGRLPALSRLKWHLASRRLITELVKVVRYERGKSSPSIVRNPIRRYVVYPYWKDDKLAVPETVYLARDEVKLRTRAHTVEWKDGRLVVTGDAYITSVSMRRRWTSVKGVVLRSGARRIPVRTRQTLRKKAWTGFEFSLNPKRLKGFGDWKDGVWEIDLGVFNAGVFRHGPVGKGSSGSGANPPYAYVTDDVRIVPEIVERSLRIRVEKVSSVVSALSWDGPELTVGITAPQAGALTLVRADQELAVPMERAGDGFTARFSLADLPVVRLPEDRVDDTVVWKLRLDGKPLVLAEDVPTRQQLVGVQDVRAERGSAGYLQVSLRSVRFQVEAAAIAADGLLTLTGAHPVEPLGEIVLRSKGRKLEYAFPLVDGAASIPLASMPTLAGDLPLRQGKWDLLFRAPGGRALAVETAPGVALPSSAEVNLRAYTMDNVGSRLVVEVGSDLTAEEQGGGTKLRQEARARVKEQGLRDTVLYSCFNGRQYSDSTRAIHEELVRRGAPLEHLWVVGDGQVALPPSAKAVRLNGREWHEAVASSRYIVTNHRIGDWFHRHPDQTVLQTWHGTPLKKIGRDVKEVHFAYAPGMQKAMATAEREPRLPEWTHLVSPNKFSTKILKRAFKFEGEIIEAGYPRNDVLYAPDAAEIAADVRARLGIPDGKKIVLYAPTWRDDQFYGRGRYKADWRIDLDQFAEELGDDHVLVARLHPNVVDGAPDHPSVFDAGAYPDIAELYLAADVLVSDYSSVMFDYANLRRPMIFYTYDLAHYRDKLRGFYFDFEKESPGPLVETSADLIAAIRDLPSLNDKYAAAYDTFYDRFCALDDGKAAARVVDKVFKL
ncbi:hypothetical protein GCM10027589_10150 [Actinocorallia lasiicapitis]